MNHRERIALYLSGETDRETEWRTENALLADSRLLSEFIELCEASVLQAPPALSDAVMSRVRMRKHAAEAPTLPLLSRKMCAAVCFCSAAAILLFSLSGLGGQLLELVSGQFSKLGEMLSSFRM